MLFQQFPEYSWCITQVETEANKLLKFPIALKSNKFSKFLVERYAKVNILEIQLDHTISFIEEKMEWIQIFHFEVLVKHKGI